MGIALITIECEMCQVTTEAEPYYHHNGIGIREPEDWHSYSFTNRDNDEYNNLALVGHDEGKVLLFWCSHEHRELWMDIHQCVITSWKEKATAKFREMIEAWRETQEKGPCATCNGTGKVERHHYHAGDVGTSGCAACNGATSPCTDCTIPK